MRDYPQYKFADKIEPREAPRAPEVPIPPEAKPEIKPTEGRPEVPPGAEGPPVAVPVKPLPVTPPSLPKEPVLAEIETILSEGLSDVYKQMPPDKQADFKAEGERVASRIRAMVAKARIKVHEILRMIRRWLRIIPGVNKFFLEQEAKIKTDKIIELAQREK